MSLLEAFYYTFASDASALDKGLAESEKKAGQLKNTVSGVDAQTEQLGTSFLSLAKSAAGLLGVTMTLAGAKVLALSTAETTSALGMQARQIVQRLHFNPPARIIPCEDLKGRLHKECFTMTALQLPCTIFKTQKWMDDYSASDMRCGDLTEAQLKSHYRLDYISDRVDPWTLTRRSPMDRPQSMFCCNLRGQGEKMTRLECVRLLFDEFRSLSRKFSFYGPYSHLIEKMITHMQNGNGTPFRDMSLDRALKEHILNDKTKNSTRLRLHEIIEKNIDWDKKCYPANEKNKLKEMIIGGKLPKFDRFQDNFNGMGITVHDTWATHITIRSLQIDNDRYRAVVHYKVQDHFGLDSDDILKTKFSQLHFFRIWFVLQRYNQFGFKPFMTNMEATVEITGGRNESKK